MVVHQITWTGRPWFVLVCDAMIRRLCSCAPTLWILSAVGDRLFFFSCVVCALYCVFCWCTRVPVLPVENMPTRQAIARYVEAKCVAYMSPQNACLCELTLFTICICWTLMWKMLLSCDTWLAPDPITRFKTLPVILSCPPSHHCMCTGSDAMHYLLTICNHLRTLVLHHCAVQQQHNIFDKPLSSTHLRLVSIKEFLRSNRRPAMPEFSVQWAALCWSRCISRPNIYTADWWLRISLSYFQVSKWCCCKYRVWSELSCASMEDTGSGMIFYMAVELRARI